MSTLTPAEKAALDTLTEMNANYEWPRLNESLFVNKYLPILTYNLTRPAEEHIKVKTEIWVREVAKNPYHSVLVVDDSDQVLFWVPPILRTGGIFQQKSGMASFYEVAANAAKQNTILPGAGNAHLVVSAEQRLKGNVDLKTDQQQWYLILHRYGILDKVVGVEGFVPPTAKANIEKHTDDSVTFGDIDEW